MVNVQVNGRMVADAELKTAQNGSQFISGRFAVDDFSNGEKTTAWFRLTIDASERNKKALPFLTKGKMLSLIGTESLSIYTDKEGKPQINRDIRVDRLNFISSGSSGDTASQTATTDATPTSCGTFKRKEETPMPSMAASTSSAEDDLPF